MMFKWRKAKITLCEKLPGAIACLFRISTMSFCVNLHAPFCSGINCIRDALVPDAGEHGQDEDPDETDFCRTVWDIFSANQFNYRLFWQNHVFSVSAPEKNSNVYWTYCLIQFTDDTGTTGQHTLIAG